MSQMATRTADSISADRPADGASQASGALVWWHALWGLAVLAAGAGLYAGFGEAPREVYYALACGIAPCLMALVVQSLPRTEARAILLVVWASFGAAACLLTGGVTGPLAPWILAPVAARGGARPLEPAGPGRGAVADGRLRGGPGPARRA